MKTWKKIGVAVGVAWLGVFVVCLGYEFTHPATQAAAKSEPDSVQLCDTLYTLTANRTSHLSAAEKGAVAKCEALGFSRLPSQDSESKKKYAKYKKLGIR